MTEVNWLGTVYTVKAALPFLLEGGGGHIVVMSSGRGTARLSRRRRLQRDEGRAADVRRGPAPRAGRHRRVGDDRLSRARSGRRCTTTRARGCRTWYRGGPNAASAEVLADADRQGRRARQPPPALPPARQGHGHPQRPLAGGSPTASCGGCAARPPRRGASRSTPRLGSRRRGRGRRAWRGTARGRPRRRADRRSAGAPTSRHAGRGGQAARHVGAQAVDDDARLGGVAARQHEAELLAADPREQVDVADLPRQRSPISRSAASPAGWPWRSL